MQSILDAINEWIKEILMGAINGNLSTMFGDVNEKVGTIAAEVGRTPQAWNANIFSMIRTLSENVIVPIAGLVITYVLCYELISMVNGFYGKRRQDPPPKINGSCGSPARPGTRRFPKGYKAAQHMEILRRTDKRQNPCLCGGADRHRTREAQRQPL